MKTSLTKGLNEDQKKELILNFRASALFRERLATLSREKVETKRRAAKSMTAFENPSWAYQQAWNMGYEVAMDEIISLISSESVEKS